MKTSAYIRLLSVFGLASLRLFAEPAPADSAAAAPVQSPPQAYTDQGTTTYYDTTSTYINYGSVYPYSSHYPSPYSDVTGMYSFNTRVRVQSRPIYYPPTPPALGETDYNRRVRASLAKLAPPAALAEYVYEPFYAPLSTLLYTEDLSKKRRERLDDYHARRAALLAELRARLESLQTADPATREAGLADLAAGQASRLAALEATAEELRDNFANGSFFDRGSDWNDGRQWRLGDDTRWESSLDELKVVRGAVAFQEGLSPAQRRLLREIQMELADGLRDPTEEIALSTPGPFLYFSPETARIRLPAELPADLAAKIDLYQSEKAALKQELRDLLYRYDRAFFSSSRTNAIKTLAEQQAGRFARVEQLAEEIRRGLAPLPNPARPPVLALPAGLSARLADYSRKKSALQAALLAKQEEVRQALPKDRVEFSRVRDTYVLNVVANRRSTPEMVKTRQAIVDSLTEFNRQQAKVYSELARAKEALRAEIMRTANEMKGPKSIDQLLREFAYAFKKQESWELYRDYETAVLEPGLSPAQRVLLFGAALEKLDLPLAN